MEIAGWSVDPRADVVSNFETDWFAAFQGFRTRLPQFSSTRQNPFCALLTFTKATIQAQKKAARTKGIIFQSILVCWDVPSEFVVFWTVDHDVTVQQSTINKLFRSRRLTSPKLRWRTFPGTSAGRVCCGSRYSSTFFDLNLPKHEICSIGATVLAAWKWYDGIRPAEEWRLVLTGKSFVLQWPRCPTWFVDHHSMDFLQTLIHGLRHFWTCQRNYLTRLAPLGLALAFSALITVVHFQTNRLYCTFHPRKHLNPTNNVPTFNRQQTRKLQQLPLVTTAFWLICARAIAMAVLERVNAAIEGKASLQDVDQALQDSSA